MRDRFYNLADDLFAALRGGEVALLGFDGEASDFVRFSGSRVRQAGSVEQQTVGVRLIQGQRQACSQLTLTGRAEDRRALRREVEALRAMLPLLPEDPHLLYATDVRSTEDVRRGRLPSPDGAMAALEAVGLGRDMVGLYASGRLWRGFANSLGQRNWFARDSFHLDWSFYHHGDKAARNSYAGFTWSRRELARKAEETAGALARLRQEPRTIPPGQYRVYLAPAALAMILGLLGWGGFGLKSQRTKQSPLLKLVEGEAALSPLVTLRENTADGLAPAFSGEGYLKPAEVTLVRDGRHAQALVSPRSAKEYGVPTTGGGEGPESVELAAGAIPPQDVLRRLDRGVYVNTLWYLNYSDRMAGRITGMTRFATFWVEGGRLVAPLNVMRFDETVYRMLGAQLIGLTSAPEFLPDGHTYFQRSTSSIRTPGALIDDFTFTL